MMHIFHPSPLRLHPQPRPVRDAFHRAVLNRSVGNTQNNNDEKSWLQSGNTDDILMIKEVKVRRMIDKLS
jgi:hypothetical protein